MHPDGFFWLYNRRNAVILAAHWSLQPEVLAMAFSHFL